jgi:hypothetical protein
MAVLPPRANEKRGDRGTGREFRERPLPGARQSAECAVNGLQRPQPGP